MGTLLSDHNDERDPYWVVPTVTIKDDAISVGIITSDHMEWVKEDRWYCTVCKARHHGEEILIVSNGIGICSCGGYVECNPF